jgi:alpha-mannosidase
MRIATGIATSQHDALQRLKHFAHPLQARLMPQLPHCTGKGHLPALQASLQIDHPAMVLSALRPSATPGETILRFYSTSERTETVTLKLWKSVGRYCPTDLLEQWQETTTHAFTNGTIVLDVAPHKIVTLLIE